MSVKKLTPEEREARRERDRVFMEEAHRKDRDEKIRAISDIMQASGGGKSPDWFDWLAGCVYDGLAECHYVIARLRVDDDEKTI